MVRVIPVTGLSGTGKTTFIRALIPLLSRLGPVGTVKHVGHHTMELPEDKDTTTMFGAGAEAAIGIDREKMLITLDSTSLADALEILAGQGIAFAIVEGYKSSPLPKIAIGDVKVEGCILRNPEPEEVIRSLDRFPSYFTLGEIVRELGEDCRAGRSSISLTASTTPLPSELKGDILPDFERELPRVAESVKVLPGIIGTRIVVQRGSLFGKADQLFVAVAGEDGDDTAEALSQTIRLYKELLEAHGICLR
ncbi:MAG: molybdopterin-guanine dinucleotide biosynthesis protein B [Methanomicrobiales archaeon]|nr:molybdopterin-guanine dinucleotide biosynthesis protein B [Methanomicrobiales archaeon]